MRKKLSKNYGGFKNVQKVIKNFVVKVNLKNKKTYGTKQSKLKGSL